MAKSLAPLLLLLLLALGTARAVDSDVPSKPTRYFNDYALALKPGTAERLNTRLADFERETSNQILVAIFPRLKTDTDVADFAQRTFRAWQPGQKGRDNGAILFVFLEDHKMRIQTGRGLEGAIPDALARRIIGDEIAPRFKTGDLDGGLEAGVNAMLGAAKGEYQGTGRTVAQGRRGDAREDGSHAPVLFLVLIGFFVLAFIIPKRRSGTVYSGRGYGGPIIMPMGGGGGGFGGFGGGGGGGGGDSGGFSSGGGDSGGGGASGDW